MSFWAFLLQSTNSTSVPNYSGAVSQISALVVQAIMLVFQLGDILAAIIQVVFSQVLGVSLPILLWRVITIAIGVLVFWKFIGTLGYIGKFAIVVLVLGMIVSMFVGSAFNSNGILNGSWLK